MNYLFPVKIVKAEGVSGAEMLLRPKALQIGLKTKELAVFSGKSYVILDFGKELQGGARVLTFHGGPQKNVRLRFGESVTEVCAELGEKNATNDHSLRDMTVSLSDYSDMTFGCTGFRFLRVDALSENAHILIGGIVAAAQIDGRAEPGTFTCSDPLVNRIWETAAYTMRLCLQNGYMWDGIKRDRLVWIGDLYAETRASHCLFGDTPEVRNSLDYARDETGLPGWMNNFPSYSLWWIMILRCEYGRSGDAAYLTRLEELCLAALGEMPALPDAAEAARFACLDKKNTGAGKIVLTVPASKGEYRLLELDGVEYERELIRIGRTLC